MRSGRQKLSMAVKLLCYSFTTTSTRRFTLPLQILRCLRGTVGLQTRGTTFLHSLVVLGGLLLLIIPGVLFFVRFAFAISVVTLERTAYASAMHRSRESVKGHWWRLSDALLFFIMITYIGSSMLGRILCVPIAVLGVSESCTRQPQVCRPRMNGCLRVSGGVFPGAFAQEVRDDRYSAVSPSLMNTCKSLPRLII
jgi:hypothetical protein